MEIETLFLKHKIITSILILSTVILFISGGALSAVGLFSILFFISIIALFFGLIKPSFVKMDSRKKVLKIFLPAVFLFFIFMAITIPTPKLSPEEKQIKQEEKVAEQVKEEQEKQTRLVAEREKQVAEQVKQEQEKEQAKIKQEEADKNLENFMELGSQSGMIKDAKAGVIYVSDNWFLWTVKDKENFITFGSERLNDATGYGDIKIRHYKSNELLGEFSWGKSQVYK